jgi:hypothetical protein
MLFSMAYIWFTSAFFFCYFIFILYTALNHPLRNENDLQCFLFVLYIVFLSIENLCISFKEIINQRRKIEFVKKKAAFNVQWWNCLELKGAYSWSKYTLFFVFIWTNQIKARVLPCIEITKHERSEIRSSGASFFNKNYTRSNIHI